MGRGQKEGRLGLDDGDVDGEGSFLKVVGGILQGNVVGRVFSHQRVSSPLDFTEMDSHQKRVI